MAQKGLIFCEKEGGEETDIHGSRRKEEACDNKKRRKGPGIGIYTSSCPTPGHRRFVKIHTFM
jgi:hypothetical protein